MNSDAWSVVAIVKERPEVLRRFVAWYITQGAQTIRLYFDDPDDPSIDLVAALPQVHAVRCTPEFWESIGCPPDKHFTWRQNVAIHHGYHQIGSGWVLNVDADELIWAPQRPVGSFLADQPENVRAVLVAPLEYVSFPDNSDETLFRRPMNARQAQRIYGDFALYMAPNNGFVGHFIGKSFTRAGIAGVTQGHPHWYLDENVKRIRDADTNCDDGLGLLHFYHLDYEDWRRKITYRSQARARGRREAILSRLQELLARGDETGLKEMYRKMHEISADQRRRMEKRGLCVAPDLGLERVVSKVFGD